MSGLYIMRNPTLVVSLVTLYLIVFTILGQLNADLSLMFTLFSLSPLLVIWMVYTVLKYGTFKGKELEQDEEWAYEDYPKK